LQSDSIISGKFDGLFIYFCSCLPVIFSLILHLFPALSFISTRISELSRITHLKRNKLVNKWIAHYSLLLMSYTRRLKKNKMKSQNQRTEFEGHHRGKKS